MKEVYPGIFMITERGISGTFKPPVNLYVITGSNGLVFDGGYGNRGCIRQFARDFSEIEKICKDRGVQNSITRIMLSHAHADHFSGLMRLSRKYRLSIILTKRMSEIIKDAKTYRASYTISDNNTGKKSVRPVKSVIRKLFSDFEFFIYRRYWGIEYISSPHIIIEENSTIDINGKEWEILHSPGHSDDHITLYDPSTGVLFAGDNIMRSINVWLGPPRSDLDLYSSSLERILALEKLELILSAHGSPITEPRKRIEAILSWRRKRMQDVMNIISSSGKEGVTLKEILSQLYPGEGKVKHDFARGWIELTVHKLAGEGKITINNEKYIEK